MLLFSLGGVVGEELDGHETVARRHCVAILRDPVSLSYVHLYKHTHTSILQHSSTAVYTVVGARLVLQFTVNLHFS